MELEVLTTYAHNTALHINKSHISQSTFKDPDGDPPRDGYQRLLKKIVIRTTPVFLVDNQSRVRRDNCGDYSPKTSQRPLL